MLFCNRKVNFDHFCYRYFSACMFQNASFVFINTKSCSKIWLCLRNLLGALCPWGSVDYTNYSQSTTDIGGTDEDIVTVAWGKKWRTPSWENAEELINNTTRSKFQEGYFGNVSAYVWTGINDEIIVMPIQNRSVINAFWTSTPSYIENSANIFRVDGSNYWHFPKSNATEIRPIMVK